MVHLTPAPRPCAPHAYFMFTFCSFMKCHSYSEACVIRIILLPAADDFADLYRRAFCTSTWSYEGVSGREVPSAILSLYQGLSRRLTVINTVHIPHKTVCKWAPFRRGLSKPFPSMVHAITTQRPIQATFKHPILATLCRVLPTPSLSP